MRRNPAHVVSLALIGVFGLVGTSAAQPPSNDAAALLARLGCAGCHGERGAGSALAPAIAGPGLSADQLRAALRQPRGAMPAFGPEAVGDEDIAALHAALGAVPTLPQPTGRAEVGGRRFEQVGCYACHSNQGQGGTQGPRIAPRPIRWERFSWYVRHPAGQMPPYSEAVLTDQDLADIRAFLASRPEPRPLADIALLTP